MPALWRGGSGCRMGRSGRCSRTSPTSARARIWDFWGRAILGKMPEESKSGPRATLCIWASVRGERSAVFNTRLDVGVGSIDEFAERGIVACQARSELYMAHEFARALQQAIRIRQGCSLKEADVDVRSECVDVSKGDVSQARNRTAIVQKLPDLISATAHDLEPATSNGA